MEKLPNLGKVYSMIVHEETQQHMTDGTNGLQCSTFYYAKIGNSVKAYNNNASTSMLGNPPTSIPSSSNPRKRLPPPSEPFDT